MPLYSHSNIKGFKYTMSLKDLTKQKHTDAERTEFAKKLLSGSISEADYATYLGQMLEVYSVLEYQAAMADLLNDLPGIARAKAIYEDLIELDPNGKREALPATKEYMTYLHQLGADEERKHLLMAHLYVRHMGDLYGGQIISKRVPGSGKFYQFNNKEALIASIRSKLDDSMGDEANVAFDHAIAIMKELNEPSMEHAD
jgi:heme oxygenase